MLDAYGRILARAYYRALFDEVGLHHESVTSVDELLRLPLLDRQTLRATMRGALRVRRRFAVIRKTTSGSSGQPVEVFYNAESRHWRDATRWRGYGWGGYEIGMKRRVVVQELSNRLEGGT